MSRKPKKRTKQRPPTKTSGGDGGGLGFLLGALGFGVLCIAAGVLIVVLGVGGSGDGAATTASETPMVGYWLIALGVVAVGLSIFIYRQGH